MTIAEMQREILRRKKERDVCIPCPQPSAREILEIAGFYRRFLPAQRAGEARRAAHAADAACALWRRRSTAVAGKRVLLANSEAGCPMAEQMDKPLIKALRAQYPDYAVVASSIPPPKRKRSATSASLLRRAGRPPNEGRENHFSCPTAIWAIMWRSRSPKRPSSSFRAAVPSTPGDGRRRPRRPPRAPRRCWCTPNARPTCCGRRISSVRPPPLWTMRRHLPKTRSLSAPKSASPRICRMLFPKALLSAFQKLHLPRT